MLTVNHYKNHLFTTGMTQTENIVLGYFPLIGMHINCIKRLKGRFIQPFWLYHNYCFCEVSERLEASDQQKDCKSY